MYAWNDCTLNSYLVLLYVIWIVSFLYTNMFKLIYQLGSMLTCYLFLSVFDNSQGLLDRHIIYVYNLILLFLYILFYIYLYSIAIKCMDEESISCFQMWTSILKKEEFRRFFWYSFPFQIIVSFSMTSWDDCETDL